MSRVSFPLALALLSMVLWGGWAFFVKLALQRTSHQSVLVVSYVVATTLLVAYALWSTESLALRSPGTVYAVAGGVTAAGGVLAYYVSLERGAISTATPITGLYFVVAAVLGVVFLDESLSYAKLLGVVLAGVSVVLLTQ